MTYNNELEHFSLRWNNFNDNMKTGFHELLRREDFVDVTIAAEGKLIQAHKMVLSICSPYFKNIFKTNPCQHPVVFLKDVTHKELSGILQFMYLGEVSVQQEELGKFLKTAEALQIKGLTGEDSNEDKSADSSYAVKDVKQWPNKKKTKFVQSNSVHKEAVLSKRMKISSPSNETNKKNSQISSTDTLLQANLNLQSFDAEPFINAEASELDLLDPKAEPLELENDSLSVKDENVNVNRSDSALQLTDNASDIGDEYNSSPNTPMTSGMGHEIFSGLGNESYSAPDGNQEIRFVMSPRMRPCLVFHNYLYIKDHVGVAMPGQPKTIYWRCKDINCKARCIQTDFKFRLKRNTFHQHSPNIDRNYLPIQMDRACDIIKFLK